LTLKPPAPFVEEKSIAPHIPVFDRSKRDDGTFSRSAFRYDPTSDVYHCPGGKRLGTSARCTRARRFCIAQASWTAMYAHSNRSAAPRNLHARSRATSMRAPETLPGRSLGTESFEQSRRERKKIEMRFAHLKRILRLGRLRLRGPRGAQDEFTLAAIAQNLRRLATLVARPPPARALCSA
jgi:hypothetical protein